MNIKYPKQDLQIFEEIILKKLKKAQEELKFLKNILIRQNEINTNTNFKPLENSPEANERENISQLADRQQKFIQALRSALERVYNGTYGICISTQKLIPKERLYIVPHTRYAINTKLK